MLLNVLRCQLTYIALRPRKPEGSLGRTAQDGHLDSHTVPELCADQDQNGMAMVVVYTEMIKAKTAGLAAVSYTHLTLPTNHRV